MTNWRPQSPDMYEDIQTRWQYENTALHLSEGKRLRRMWLASRDSARTPVQWTAGENAGFTTGKPWFYVNPNYREVNVEAEEKDPDSLLNFYKKAIALRKSLEVVRSGSYREYNALSSRRYTYSRISENEKLLVLCSFVDEPIPLKVPRGFDLSKARLVLQNDREPQEKTLQPYETRVYYWGNGVK